MGLSARIGERLRSMRLRRGHTLREAAPLCGVSFQMLGQIENGQNTTFERLEAILIGLDAKLDIEVSDLDDTSPSLTIGRAAIAERFLAVLPNIPEEELEVFLHEVSLWERRYGSVESP